RLLARDSLLVRRRLALCRIAPRPSVNVVRLSRAGVNVLDGEFSIPARASREFSWDAVDLELIFYPLSVYITAPGHVPDNQHRRAAYRESACASAHHRYDRRGGGARRRDGCQTPSSRHWRRR